MSLQVPSGRSVREWLRPRTRLRGALARMGRRLAELAPPAAEAEVISSVNDRYVEDAPSDASALEVFAGHWITRFPAPLDEVSGDHQLLDDPRIERTVDALGGIDGQRVLELGPLEGAHTAMLERLGAASVVAVEANIDAWLRCLVTKEVLGLTGVEFRLGDFRPYLEATEERFDLAVAVGVLYHLDDPVPVLHDLMRVSDRLAIWTHVHRPSAARSINSPLLDTPVTRSHADCTYRLHRFRYEATLADPSFCGGTRPTAAWIDADDLLAVLEKLGHEIVHHEDIEHDHGPSVLLATRRASR